MAESGSYCDRFAGGAAGRIIRIGLGVFRAMVEELPEEAHDRRVDVIVTEAGIVRPARERGLSP